ncbi:outward-rectifier potassium channel Tok1p [Trichomonascus vanleenenianus]|uniref:Tok1p n=1 Tax=Trichomonascus vanleenenianus TaxID=2268995 RepID=UPI003EC9BCA4
METAQRRRFSFTEFVDPERGRLAATLTHNLLVKPGEKGFFRWYVISSPLPIIAASLGPLSNLNSVVALVDDWRTVPLDSTVSPPSDEAWFIVLNAISLFIACVANISLLLNFSRRINYNFSQVISIGGWYIASFILLALIITSQYVYFDGQDEYIRSQGYWHAVIACVLYFASSTMLLINEFGHLLGNYHASFNLTSKQRSIMIQNVLLMVWIGGGGAVFGDLLAISYADGIYFCVVTILTIGLGDLVAHNDLGRALVLPYAFIGVIMLGLIIATIRQIVLEAGGQTIKLHRAEKRRHNKLKQAGDMIRDGTQVDPEAELEEKAFQEMRNVHEHAVRSHRRFNAIVSVIFFVSFLLFGAMVFSLTEPEWTYFIGVYFCALCLLTIGYGDFTPTSNSGRPLFVVWALFAIPLMTILVSNLGDTLFKELLEGGRSFANWVFSSPKSARGSNGDIESRSSTLGREDDDDTKSASASSKSSSKRHIIGQQPPSEDQRSVLRNTREQCHVDSRHGEGEHPLRSLGSMLDDIFGSTSAEHRAELDKTIQICDHIRQVLHHQLEDPTHAFTYDEWREMLEITGSYNRACSRHMDEYVLSEAVAPVDIETLSSEQKRALYWLGDRSPLRYPIVETDFFLVKYFDALERQIITLVTGMAALRLRNTSDPSEIRSATVSPTTVIASTTSVATAPAAANTTGFTRNTNDSTASVKTGSNKSTCTRYESPMPYTSN